MPFIKGWFLSEAMFRSDDMKKGRILATIGSSAGISYYSEKVILEDNTTHSIELGVMPEPLFEDSKPNIAVQQGAGFSVLKCDHDKAKEKASITFLKWISQKKILCDIAVNASYIPALKDRLKGKNLEGLLEKNKITKPHQIATAKLTADIVLSKEMYTAKPFKKSLRLRHLLQDTLKNTCLKDRAIVLERLKDGLSSDDAMKEFLDDEYFEKWYKKLCKDMIEIINEN